MKIMLEFDVDDCACEVLVKLPDNRERHITAPTVDELLAKVKRLLAVKLKNRQT